VRKIPLTQGKFCLASYEDYKELSKYRWYYKKWRSREYAERTISVNGKPKNIQMHRVITGAKPGEEVDHRDGNGLNNCRENLRVCTHVENIRNQKRRVDNTSGYKGVTFENQQKQKPWRARIRIGKRIIHLGLFSKKEDAARAYDKAALKFFGEFAKGNT
jgi:putative SOS response-associated peptidase YedK